MRERILTYIIAEPNRTHISLRAILMTIPVIELADRSNEAVSALARINASDTPALIILDIDYLNGAGKRIEEDIKIRPIQVKCIVLANKVQDKQMAKAMEADVMLLKGFSVEELSRTITDLLP